MRADARRRKGTGWQVTLRGGHVLTTAVYIDHNAGTIAKDAFVVSEPLGEVVERVRAAAADDPDTAARPLSPADAKLRIGEAIKLSAMTFPPARLTAGRPAARSWSG